MDLSNIPTYMLREELNRRERKHRIAWLKAHNLDANGCDLCHSIDCRIDCTGCDCEDDEYIPLYND